MHMHTSNGREALQGEQRTAYMQMRMRMHKCRVPGCGLNETGSRARMSFVMVPVLQ